MKHAPLDYLVLMITIVLISAGVVYAITAADQKGPKIISHAELRQWCTSIAELNTNFKCPPVPVEDF
jgi:hypothetical protein